MNTTPATTTTRRDIRSLLQSDGVKQQLAMVLPKHLTADRMARVACTAVLRTPKLAQASPESLLQALMLCSQAGLEPDGRQAHLIPFENRRTGTVDVQVIFDYKGLISLARRNGITGICADVVCEGDQFEWSRGANGLRFSHTVDWKRGRGDAYAAFCFWRDADGSYDGECMSKDEIEAIRRRSRSGSSGPWVTDWAEMAKKTVIRRASKRWPIDAEATAAVEAAGDEDEKLAAGPSVDAVPFASIADHPSDEDPELEKAKHANDPAPAAAKTHLDATGSGMISAQQALGDFVIASGFTFEQFAKWGKESGNIEGEVTSFDAVPTPVAARLLRAKAGLKTQIAGVVGGAK